MAPDKDQTNPPTSPQPEIVSATPGTPGAMPGGQAVPVPNRPRIGRPVFAGLFALTLFFGGFIGWASYAQLSSAAVALGSLSIDTNSKNIQHLEGGIVRQINVREGQHVKQGEILIVLDQTRARANIILLTVKIASASEQLLLLADEIGGVEKLFRKGLTQKPRLLALKRRRAELQGQRLQDRARLRAARDVIARASIRAPLAGVVIGLKVHSRGGVISPGAVLMSIVPDNEKLVVEARIEPNDIDIVRKGLDARVRLTPFSARQLQPLKGVVLSVSADAITDERTGQKYYLARIELAELPAELRKPNSLYPGMPVEVMVITGERTMLDYILSPLIKSFGRAFREG
ncbi:MAG: HlyD family efflux transporter periplasmic adaptor subunit [Alphaproteobacteria bacterium]